MDCDGPKHVMIHDLDGSLTGLGPDSSILARAEFMNERRKDASKFTWISIPTKMLYDPAPLNDPTDPGWDMSSYQSLTGDIFSYRRLDDMEPAPAGTRAAGQINGDGPIRGDGPLRGALAISQAGGVPDGAILSNASTAAWSREASARRLESVTNSGWMKRMVFYSGDERADFPELFTLSCDASSALFDPACRSQRKPHTSVAYRGYGIYRTGCTKSDAFNAWLCPGASIKPARLIIESMDVDHMTRSITPVALASGGYVDLLNGGWDHQSPQECGGYECLRRLMTFHSVVAVNRSYDLAFAGTNPEHLRLMMPHGGGEPRSADLSSSRILVSIFYSNPEKLEVYYNKLRVLPLEHSMTSANSYNFSMRKPVVTDPCGSNAFAGWENKIYVVVCGGIPGIEIKQARHTRWPWPSKTNPHAPSPRPLVLPTPRHGAKTNSLPTATIQRAPRRRSRRWCSPLA